MNHDIHIQTHYAHPIAKVWSAITDSRSLADWLMQNDFKPELGHAFTFRTEPRPGFDGIIRCKVTRLEPPHVLAFTWLGGPINTVVTFVLKEKDGGTEFTLSHTGFEGPMGAAISEMLGNGWKSNILEGKLPALLRGAQVETSLPSLRETGAKPSTS